MCEGNDSVHVVETFPPCFPRAYPASLREGVAVTGPQKKFIYADFYNVPESISTMKEARIWQAPQHSPASIVRESDTVVVARAVMWCGEGEVDAVVWLCW